MLPLIAALLLAHDAKVHTSQVGYTPRQIKWVLVEGPKAPRTFEVIDAAGQVAFSGALSRRGLDRDSGQVLFRGDFTGLARPGTYQVKVPGRGASHPFVIAEDAFHSVLKLATRWFYLQRSGVDKDDKVTGVHHRADHTSLAILRDETGPHPEKLVDVRGGWWDAGDFGRYVPSAASSVQTLLYAYRLNPAAFADSTLQIPESGNGVPDLLDEVRWELSWLLKMQRQDGAFHHKVATKEVPGASAPEDDTQPLYLFQVTSQATAQAAAVLAQASVVYQPVDAALSARMLLAARKAWSFLAAHPEQVPAGGFKNPDDPTGGGYATKLDEAELRLWAASALLLATSDRAYLAPCARLWEQRDRDRVYGLSWAEGAVFAMVAYLDSPLGDPRIKAAMRKVIATQVGQILALIRSTGYGVALRGTSGDFAYDWGSSGTAQNAGVYLLLAYELGIDRRPEVINGAALQLHYMLGQNALDKALITGAGANPVQHPHHRLSWHLHRPVPGAIGEGPNATSVAGDPVLARLFQKKLPAALRYADDDLSYATNEPTIYYNAPFVALAAFFAKP